MTSRADFRTSTTAAPPPSGGITLSQKDMTFIVSPPEISFHSFEPHKTYEATLHFKNQTKTAKFIRLMQPESRFFAISEPRGGANSLKVAAGLSISYTIYFTPEVDGDYECDLIAVTENEKFIVPVYAVGSRGQLSFPSEVHFPNSPIKATSKSTVLVMNVGTKACEWRATATPPFGIAPSFGRIEPQGSMQVVVEFMPLTLGQFASGIVFDLGHGDTQTMNVSGDCVDVAISMDKSTLVIPKTFISLERQGIVKVSNNSDATVEFCWKAHATAEEESAARLKKLAKLDAIERARGGSASLAAQRQLAARRASLEAQPILFDDEVFTIEPATGKIPAKGVREFVVTFNPQLAMAYPATAFLDIQGKKDRLPLVIKGVGLGPECALSFDSLDLGDIFINSMHQYEVVIENRGSIEAKFAVNPQLTLFGPKFKFSPSSGSIPAGQTQTVEIGFCSDIIGIVSETFRIHVQGSRDELELHFKGRVIGPTFHFDVEELDYGNVSYNFWHVKTFNLVNTSEIPMRFHLRVPEDQGPRKEFDVIPATGMILPHGKQKIQVDFLSNTVQEYNAHLVVDIDEVGENLDSLPIKATCIVPDVVVSNDALDYGHCFVNNKDHRKIIELRNDTALSAKYEFILPAEDDPIRKKAEITVGNGDPKERKGIVHARSSLQLSIQLVPRMTGNIHLPLYVRILGSDRAPHHIAISAKVTGPKIEVLPKLCEFGSVEVLSEHQRSVVIANHSPIPAEWSAKLLGKHPANVIAPFSLKVSEGVIKPHGTQHLYITAFLDESMKFADEIAISVTNNVEQEMVQVTATGKGYTLVPSIPLELVDFGDLFTTVPVKRVFTLYNKGRRPQAIQWNNERGKAKEGDPPVIFTITPERANILGKSEETFTIEGLSNAKGVFTEKFLCKMSQTHKSVFKATVQGSFQPPLLQYSSSSLQFGYTYSPDGPQNFVSTKPLTMKNVSPLDLDFSIKVGKGSGSPGEVFPFSIDQSEFSLKKDESVAINITFDASYRGDRVSHKTTAKLAVTFANHSQKDTITLTGELQFPNLDVDAQQVDFGCILNDTEVRKVISITNTSSVPATYTWVFEEDEVATSRSTKKNEVPVPINNVFDLIPFRGVIAPGAKEHVEVLFCGIPGRKFAGTAVCQVEGGPDYSLQLLGEASSIHYKFDRVSLDYGAQEYDKWEEKEVFITNTGRVPFAFQVDLSILSRPGMVEVVPMNGIVKDKVRLLVRFSPRVPDRIDDSFRVQIAHFEPQIINVKGHGLYSSIVVSAIGAQGYVSRNDPPTFAQYLKCAKTKQGCGELKPYTAIPTKNGEPLVDPVLAEAERLYFRDIITDDAMMMKSIANGEAVEVSERAAIVKRKTFNGDTKYILSRYVVDLGNIVKGEMKRKAFRITNTSTTHISFAVDRRALTNTGVQLTPDKYPKLAAHGQQNVEVTLNTKTKGIGVGSYSHEVLVDIKGGPLVLLEVRAFIIVPQLEVSSDRLDFGKVLVGMTRIITVAIENTQALPCEWSASYPEPDKKDVSKAEKKKGLPKPPRFVCTPDKGTLQPHQKALVEVSFIPNNGETLQQKIHLRVAANPKIVELLCSGSGEEIELEVAPSAIDLPPIFPYQVSRRTFQLINRSSVPIEVFSFDFDQKYLVEEEILRNAEKCFTNDVLLLPPREVGSSLPDHLMEAYFNKLMEHDSRFAELDVVPVDGIPKPQMEVAPAVQPSIPLPTLEPLQPEVEQPKPVIVVVTGPPLSGKTTHTKALSRKYGLLQLDVDAVIRTAMEMDSVEGSTFRSLFHRLHDPSLPVKTELTPAMLVSVIKARLRSPDASIGVVVDDLRCCITPNGELLMQALVDAAAQLGIRLCVVSLVMDERLIELRRAIIEREACAAALERAAMVPLAEDVYDRLDEVGKKEHDLALKKLRDCKRAMQHATEYVERLAAERETLRAEGNLPTIQEEVDKELQELREAEDPKKKGAAAKKGAAVEEKPAIPWQDLSGLPRFKRLYTAIKTGSAVPEQSQQLVSCDLEVEGTAERLFDVMPLPRSDTDVPVPSAEPEKQPVEGEKLVIPPAVTMARIERPPEKRSIKPVKYFKILTPVVKEVAVAPPPTGSKADAKKQQPVATKQQEVMSEETRWIISPKGAIELTLHFCCDSVSTYERVLSFGVVGTTQEFPLSCQIASAYPEILRDPKHIFNRKIKAPPSDKPVSKAFVASKKCYDFGPLLVLGNPSPPALPGKKGEGKEKAGKSAAAAAAGTVDAPVIIAEQPHGLNSDKLHLKNTGMFPAEATLMFENEKDRCFCVQPDTVTLGPGESTTVTILSQPDQVGEIKNALVVCIKDNPEPLRIELMCFGAKPEITLDGKKECTVDFGRLLLRREERRAVAVRNVCALPVKWRLLGADKLPPEIKVDVTSGSLAIGAEAQVEVKFLSERANTFNIPLKVEVSDMDGVAINESLPFVIKGEAHDVVLEWTKELDFKTIRVGEAKKEVIRLLNKGPYEVAFMFRLPKKLQDLVTVTPMEGTLRGMTGFKEAAVTQVEVVFKSVDREIQIGKKAAEIEVAFIEPTLRELVYPTQTILVRGEALFNKFQIKPMHINFGPCLYKQKKQATFDIVNTGCFEMKFRLFSMKDGLAKCLEAPPEADPKKKPTDKKKGKDAAADLGDMQLGAFSLSPGTGVIPVGQTATVTVSIVPEGSSLFNETLWIHIEDRDPNFHPDGIPFDLEAESCVPGIIADLDSPDSDTVFEEQQIITRLDAFKKMSSVYSRDDRVFSFGTALSGRRLQERFRLTNPVKVPCVVSIQIVPRGDTPDAKVAAEAFDVAQIKAEGGKLVVPPHEHRYVTVGFTPNSLNTFSAMFEATVENGLDPKTRQLRFELRGEGSLPNLALDIPPPPSKTLDVAPAPEAGKGSKAAGAKASGQAKAGAGGTLRDEEKVAPNTLVLPRTIVGEKVSRAITVRNIGDLPATIRFSFPMSQSRGFSFPMRNEDLTLAPGVAERYSVFFEPTRIGEFASKLTMSVQDNHYEDAVITVVGEGYHETLTFAEIDENTENRLSLGDCYPNQHRARQFQLKNHAQYPVRFDWTVANPNIKCVPAQGHLQPGATKAITAEFHSSTVVQETAKCTVSFTEISQYTATAGGSKLLDWDDQMTAVRWVNDNVAGSDHNSPTKTEVESVDGSIDYAALRRPLRKVVEPLPEPKIVVGEASGAKDLLVSYNCDMTTWEMSFAEEFASSQSLAFKKTKLFQQRTIPLLLKNTGKVALPFDFEVTNTDGSPLDDTDDDNERGVFTVEPASGVLMPSQTQTVKVCFKPLSVNLHTQLVRGRLPHGPKEELRIPVSGESECPLVHFELPPSNYFATRESDLPPTDTNACVVEFFSRGVKIRNTVRFMVLNPTNMSYDFEWDEMVKGGAPSPFKCNTERGTIHSAKKYEMIFEFFPENLRLCESQWTFHIHGHTSVAFLLVGHASEPEVYFSSTKLQFGQVIVGAKTKQTVMIENREMVPYPFQFEKLPPSASVTFTPLQGVVPPNGSTPIDIVFSPQSEELYNYTLACKVRKAVTPITCNVKGEGYTTHDSLRVVTTEGVVTTVAPNNPVPLSLGTVQVNGKITRRFVLTNQGRFNLDYKWAMPANPHVTLSQTLGTVLPGSDSAVELTYAPTREGQLKDFRVSCKITNGSTYMLNLNAGSSTPNVAVSWKDFDFGPCFVHTPGSEVPFVTLTMTNRDKHSVAIDCLFDNKDHLEVDVSSFVLPPGEKRDIRVQFIPRDVVQYSEVLTFSLNDLTTLAVTLKGEGTLPKVEVVTKAVRFGTLRIGDKKEVEARVTCKSRIPTAFSLEGLLPPEVAKLGVSVAPDTLFYLKPKESKAIVFTFKPTARLRPFSAEMKMLVVGQELPFVTLSGSCQGAEVHLDNKQVQFGQVVVGTRVTKRVTIMNTGDLGLDFSWNEKKLSPDFTMSPSTGCIAAHTEQVCELTYHPTEAGRDGRRDNIDVKFNEAPPLAMSITSTQCVERPPLSDILRFSCRVRETVTNKITIKNETGDMWTLRPVIDNGVWTGPETLVVRPRESADYIITYAPQVCTKNRADGANDSGSAFFPLPTGTALLYRLDGVADVPSVAAPPIERDVVAKVQHSEKLVVSNWLKVPQRFAVTMKWSHDPSDDSIVIKGVPSLDVPPGATREYKVNFFAYKEGKVSGTVHFTNEETQEYQFYSLVFNVKGAKEVASIELRTQARVRKAHDISITNPLSKQVTLAVKVDNPEIVVPSSVLVPAKGSAKVSVEFFPLVAKEYPPAKLLLSCPELGEFPYTVMLSASAPQPEKPIRMQCALGQLVSTTLRFIHYCKTATDFAFKFSDPKQNSFIKSNGQASVKVPACADLRLGQEVAVDITFEPSRVGDVKENVEITSATGGTYCFLLHGTCTAPQRQGPIEIRPNSTAQIPFKNVFSENVVFSFHVDQPQFVLAKPSEQVQAKKGTTITVQYRPDDPSASVRGKLTVTGQSAADPAPIAWVYYLRGMKEGEVELHSPPPPQPKKGGK